MGETAPLTPRLRVLASERFASGFVLDASLDVPLGRGAVLVLFGPSGAGKTTLLRHVAGLSPADAGVVEFDGTTWSEPSRGIWTPPQKRRVGLVSQEPTLFPHLSVRENVEFGLSATARSKRAVRVSEVGGLLGIDGLLDRYPSALSGGEARRVAVARALAPSPRLLLLDEPFAALDAPTRSRLRADVRALLRRVGTPAVLVTHDRTEAMTMGDTVSVVIGGRVHQTGAVADVFSHPTDVSVAESLGVEAVLPARIVGSDDGLLTVSVGAARLSVADRGNMDRASAEVFACIRAEDVMLEAHAATGASARNHLPARILAIIGEGPIDRVTLDCGFPLDALVTRRSSEALQLAPGGTVVAAIKATSIHLVPRA